MTIKTQRPIAFINDCGCMVDEKDLKAAILRQAERPVANIKHIYLYGHYPAVSIHNDKVHVHRLLMAYWLDISLCSLGHIHHKDGNRLNALKENLEHLPAGVHISNHLTGRLLGKEHRAKIALANRNRLGMKFKKRVNISTNELAGFLQKGWSVNKIAKHYGCDWSTVRARIYENPSLLDKEVKNGI